MVQDLNGVASSTPNINVVKDYFLSLQNLVCSGLESFEQAHQFDEDYWGKTNNGGISRVLSGDTFEKAGVNFSHVSGTELPSAATVLRPELAGHAFEALGVSIVVHPYNPFAPTAHCNVRFFMSYLPDGNPVWWFGGGYDLTPYYAFLEDVVAWHQAAYTACQRFGDEVYSQFKQQCDDYFFIKHRNEMRGVGGLFFDDLNVWGFQQCFDFVQSVGNSFLPSYTNIVRKRKDTVYGESERQFQQYRRGRYVEFNLVYDRGTLFGLQSGGRAESILMSLPPSARWDYAWTPKAGSAEEDLYLHFLKPQDWLSKEIT